MNFDLNQEQTLLKDGLTRYLRQHHDFDRRRALLVEDPAQRVVWHALAEDLGVLGAAIPEAFGGLGGGAIETMIVMEALGDSLVVSPYLETVVLAGSLLRQSNGERSADLLADIATGARTVAVAIGEGRAHGRPDAIATIARRDEGGWSLDGEKSVVVGAPDADLLIVLARAPEGASLFVVERDAPGLRRHDYRLIDERRAADIVLEGVRLPADAVLGAPGTAAPIVDRALDEAIAALCAEAVGLLRRMLADTVAYTKQRRQFGQPLATFQVLQHRLVDMFMAVEQAVSATYLATLRLDADPAARAKAVSAAKVTIGKALRQVGQQAVQMHGGMGLTDLLPIGHMFKRATVIERQFGSVDHHLARYAALARADAG